MNFLVDRGYILILIHPDTVSPILQLSASSSFSWSQVLAPIMQFKKDAAGQTNMGSKSEPTSPNPKGTPKTKSFGLGAESPHSESPPTTPNFKKSKNIQSPAELNLNSPLAQNEVQIAFLKSLRQAMLAKHLDAIHASNLATWKNFSYQNFGYSKMKYLLVKKKK